MRRFLSALVLILCLLPAGCGGEPTAPGSAPKPESSETAAASLTPEEALDILSQTLLERRPRLLSYDSETGFAVDGYHFIWWTEEPPAEPEIDGQAAYEFQLLYGPDADGDLPPGQDADPIAGRLAAIYAVAKDGSACWQYGIGTDMWTPLDDTNDPILSPEEALYCGDTLIDAETARVHERIANGEVHLKEATCSRFAPATVPATMVEPLREIPGKSATACMSPMATELPHPKGRGHAEKRIQDPKGRTFHPLFQIKHRPRRPAAVLCRPAIADSQLRFPVCRRHP